MNGNIFFGVLGRVEILHEKSTQALSAQNGLVKSGQHLFKSFDVFGIGVELLRFFLHDGDHSFVEVPMISEILIFVNDAINRVDDGNYLSNRFYRGKQFDVLKACFLEW